MSNPHKPKDQYVKLRQQFIAWLLSPDRKPAHARGWAKEHGVNEATLSEWRKRPDVLAQITEWREPFRGAFSEVVHSLHKKAVKGGPAAVQAARLLSELLGENQVRIADTDARSLTDMFLAEGKAEEQGQQDQVLIKVQRKKPPQPPAGLKDRADSPKQLN